ncbi:MAG: proline dehydrogenase family protein [Anaerolineales bacterium]
MFRSFLIYLSQAAWARRLVMRLPFARRTARRFVAGETLEDAFRAVRELNEVGMLATLDLLGEHTHDAAAANVSALQIRDLIRHLGENGLRSGVSMKLTQIGLKLDAKLCAQHLREILKDAQLLGIFVRIDMEESACVDATLRLYRQMRTEGFVNLGVVIQSYLYRSEDDVPALLQEGTLIRLVKGAYLEPPDRAYPVKADADAAFDRLADLMLHASFSAPWEPGKHGDWPPLAAIASHDAMRVEFARKHAEEIGLPKQKLEFQMLYGIRRDLQRELLAQGYPVRVYVPFGKEWYPYFMRRLAERPANLWFFLSNLFRK